MSTVTPQVQHWNSIRSFLLLQSGGIGITGETPTVTVRRLSDSLYLQSGGTTWGSSPFNHPMTQVSAANEPGLYTFAVPTAAIQYKEAFPGFVFKKVNTTPDVIEYDVVVPFNRPGATQQEVEGASGDITITVDDGNGNLLQGATVRLFDAAGAQLISRGVTDADGEVTFGVPTGNYQVRTHLPGYDFASSNPTPVAVVPNDEVSPQLDGIVPATAAVGATVALYGRFMGNSSVQVVFNALAPAPVVAVSADGRVALAVVPVGLAGSSIPVRIQKPGVPSGVLQSNPVTLTVS